MSTVDIAWLRKVLGREEIRWVVERVRLRLEQGRSLEGSVSLAEATAAQRRAVEGLLGRAPRLGRSLTVTLNDLDAVIRRSGLHPEGLGPAVVALTGPVVLRAEVRAELADAWAAALEPLCEIVARRPELSPWYEAASARGLVKRACGTPAEAVPVVAAAARLLGLLPLAVTPLAQVANDVAGDAHALDHGRSLSTIVASAIRSTWWTARIEALSPAQRRRAIWDSVGIITDELSTTALALNLCVGDTRSGLARILHIARECGEPIVLTLRQLIRHTVTFDPGVVFVCENPAVVIAAANALGSSSGRCARRVRFRGRSVLGAHGGEPSGDDGGVKARSSLCARRGWCREVRPSRPIRRTTRSRRHGGCSRTPWSAARASNVAGLIAGRAKAVAR